MTAADQRAPAPGEPPRSGSPRLCATARACANIALVKYWGKRDARLNLPAAGSLSLTLDALTTTTTVQFAGPLAADELHLAGQPASEPMRERASRFLDLVRERAGTALRARIDSRNDFPTASGLASSASAYAALAVAASAALGLDLPPSELSVLARRGSGSAARSLFGGFVRMRAGSRADGSDAFAEPVPGAPTAAEWPLRMIIAVVAGGQKKQHGSTDAMEHCARTSPLHAAWLATVPGDLEAACRAIADRAIGALGTVAEHSALAMHAAAMAARPPILYFQPATLACMQRVHELRAAGIPAYFTMDAGPHVKVLTLAAHEQPVREALAGVTGVTAVLVSQAGEAPRLLESP
jgi:diphosphomevalonate decarboxylase